MVEVQIQSRPGKKHREEVDDAIKKFKKELKKSGLMNELRRREHYLSPSKAKRRKREDAIKQRKRDERREEWQRRQNNEI